MNTNNVILSSFLSAVKTPLAVSRRWEERAEDRIREEKQSMKKTGVGGGGGGIKEPCCNHGAAELGHRGNRPSAMLRKGRRIFVIDGRRAVFLRPPDTVHNN